MIKMYCSRNTRNRTVMQDKSSCIVSNVKKYNAKVNSETQSSVDKLAKNYKKSSKKFLSVKCARNEFLQRNKENVASFPSLRSASKFQVSNFHISDGNDFTGKLHKEINLSVNKKRKICELNFGKTKKKSMNLKSEKNQPRKQTDKENVPVKDSLNKSPKCPPKNGAMMKAKKVKTIKTDLSPLSQNETEPPDKVLESHCPVRKAVYDKASKQGRKRTRNRDIYDIAQDEEFIVEAIAGKKKSNHASSFKFKDKKSLKKKGNNSTNVKCKRSIQQNTKQILNSEFVIPELHEANQLAEIFPSESLRDCPNVMNDLVQENVNDDSPNDTVAQRELKDHYNYQTPDKILLSPIPTEKVAIKNTQKIFLQNFVEDFERSFIVPKMTSTPETNNVHPIACPNFNLKISELSTIPHIPSNMNGYLLPTPNQTPESTLNQVPELILNEIPEPILSETPGEEPVVSENEADRSIFDSPVKGAERKSISGEEPVVSDDESDRSIFDYPIKKSAKRKNISEPFKSSKSPRKSLQIDLFGETPPLSPVQEHLEETVLKPKKAYHTPEQFRRHLTRIKKTSVLENKRLVAKTKMAEMIEKLNDHFEECSSYELCIE